MAKWPEENQRVRQLKHCEDSNHNEQADRNNEAYNNLIEERQKENSFTSTFPPLGGGEDFIKVKVRILFLQYVFINRSGEKIPEKKKLWGHSRHINRNSLMFIGIKTYTEITLKVC